MWLYKEADRIKEQRRAREEQQRRWAAEQARREKEERRKREEEERFEQLEKDASAWRKAQRLRAYLAAVEKAAVRKSGPVEPKSKLGGWLLWARNRIAKLDPIK